MVCPLARRGFFQGRSRFAEARLLHRHPAAERHRRPHARARAEQHDPGHSRPPRAHARARKCFGCPAPITPASPRRRWSRRTLRKEEEKNAPRSRPRRISQARLGVERKARRDHHPAAEKARLLLRLVARTLHDGRGLFARRAAGFRGSLQKGLIYRGKRMVNWCPVSLTALSDEEVIETAERLRCITCYELVDEPGRFLKSRPPGRKRSWRHRASR